MSIDAGAIFSDLLQASTMALFAVSAFYIKGLAAEMKEIRNDVQRQGERIARMEGLEGGRRSDD